MKNKKNSRLSRYLDELGNEDLNKIDHFPFPWQKNFLIRFYELLKIRQYKKTDVSHNVNSNTNKNKLLPDDYTLPENTLTQFTNYKSSDMRVVSVSNLIAVSNAFDVSINYLLGIDSCETPENTDINKKTGLENKTIETIKNNKGLQEKLNFFLLSPKMIVILEEIDNDFYMQRLSHDIFNAYSNPLLTKLQTAYSNFNSETFPLDRNSKKYITYLSKEITLESIKSNKSETNYMMAYLKSNLSSDRVNDIQHQAQLKKAKDDESIYSIFINDTAQCTYELFEYKHSRESIMNKISQSFLALLDDYIQARLLLKSKKNN